MTDTPEILLAHLLLASNASGVMFSKQEGPRYRGPSCLRRCCTFAPANRCTFSPALTGLKWGRTVLYRNTPTPVLPTSGRSPAALERGGGKKGFWIFELSHR